MGGCPVHASIQHTNGTFKWGSQTASCKDLCSSVSTGQQCFEQPVMQLGSVNAGALGLDKVMKARFLAEANIKAL